MTGYTVHTGTSDKFASGWDRIFGDSPGKASGKKKKATGTTSKKATGPTKRTATKASKKKKTKKKK